MAQCYYNLFGLQTSHKGLQQRQDTVFRSFLPTGRQARSSTSEVFGLFIIKFIYCMNIGPNKAAQIQCPVCIRYLTFQIRYNKACSFSLFVIYVPMKTERQEKIMNVAIDKVSVYLRMIKFPIPYSHSVCLYICPACFFGNPELWKIVWIVIAMVGGGPELWHEQDYRQENRQGQSRTEGREIREAPSVFLKRSFLLLFRLFFLYTRRICSTRYV